MFNSNFLKLSLGIMIITGLVGCGKRSPGVAANQTQNFGNSDKVVDLAKNLNRVQKLAHKAKPANTTPTTGLTDVTASAAPEVTHAARDQKMTESIKACAIDLAQPKSDKDAPANLNYSLKVNGDKCPLQAAYSYQFQVNKDGTDSTQSHTVALAIADEGLKQTNDVHAANISGSVTFHKEKDGSGTIKGKTSGTISSVKYGQITVVDSINGKGNAKGGRIVQRLTITLGGKVTELASVETDKASVATSVVYTINGKPASETSFKAFVKKLGVLAQGISFGSQSSPEDVVEAAPAKPADSAKTTPAPAPSPAAPTPVVPAKS